MWWIVALVVLGLAAATIKIFDRKVPGSLYKVVLLVWAIGPLVATFWAMATLFRDWITLPEFLLFVVWYVMCIRDRFLMISRKIIMSRTLLPRIASTCLYTLSSLSSSRVN